MSVGKEYCTDLEHDWKSKEEAKELSFKTVSSVNYFSPDFSLQRVGVSWHLLVFSHTPPPFPSACDVIKSPSPEPLSCDDIVVTS
jgi:hypothetical protein